MSNIEDIYTHYRVPYPPTRHPAEKHLCLNHKEDGLLNLFNYIAALIDLPEDGRLFVRSKPVVCLLIQAWEKHCNTNFDDWRSLNEIYSRFRQRSIKNSLHGVKKSNPIFAFLMLFSAGEDNELPPRFYSLAPYLLYRIRWCCSEVSRPTDSYIYHLSLASRKIVGSAINHISLGEPSFDLPLQIRLALVKQTEEAKVEENIYLSTKSDQCYIHDLLLQHRQRLRSGSGGGTGQKIQRWLLLERKAIHTYQRQLDKSLNDDSLTEFRVNEKPIVTRVFASTRAPSKEKIGISGEFDVDYFETHIDIFPSEWFEDPWIARRNKRGKQEAQLFHDRLRPWDYRCISLNSTRQLIQALSVEPPSLPLGIIALSLLCGIDEKTLCGIKFANIDSSLNHVETAAKSILQGHRCIDCKKRTLWWMNSMGPENKEGYMAVRTFVELPLPPIIAKHVCVDMPEDILAFRNLHIKDANSFLQEMGDDGLSPITLKRLNSTFEGYFVGGAGLPELVADVIQWKKRPHLKSQQYYITFDWKNAVHQWSRMVDVLSTDQDSSLTEIIRKMSWTNDSTTSSEDHTGAVGTPHSNALREYVLMLLKSFPRNSSALVERPSAWNAYTAYLYLMMAVSTGRRPQRDPFPSFEHFDLAHARMYISDKYNRVFREARVVPLCKTFVATMKKHLQIHAQMYTRMLLLGFEAEIQPNHPFIIHEKEQKLIAVTPSNIDLVVDHSWKNLKNGPRHFLLTRLHHAGVPLETIDFLSGHRHVQREPEMSASTVSWEALASNLTDTIEREVIRHIGMEIPIIDG